MSKNRKILGIVEYPATATTTTAAEGNVMDERYSRSSITEARKHLRISQHLLARQANVSRYGITMFECGYGDLTDDEIARILTCLREAEAARKGKVS